MQPTGRSTKRSALLGAIRALVIVSLFSLMYRDDINLDCAPLPQHYWEIPPEEARLLGLKLLIMAPFMSLIGAIAGVVIDRLRHSAHNRYYRTALNIFMPFIFFAAITRCFFGLTFSESEKPFTQQAWKQGRINDRSCMVDDLIKHRKLIGMSKHDVENLLGQDEPDASPWRPKSSGSCLSYDLGHRTTKYGGCFVLYYKDDQITDYEMTFYKYF